VARGPQGALYGAGSLSGVYRIVTRKPDLEAFFSEARATAAVTENGDPSYAAEGFVNYPLTLFGQTVGLRLAAYQEEQGGYLDNTRLDRSNVDRTLRRGARLSMLYEPTDDLSINLTVAGQHLRSDDTHYTSPGFGLKREVRIPEPHVNDIELATATVRYSWGWGELTSSTGAVRHRYGSVFDGTSSQRFYNQLAETSAYAERTRTTMLVEDLVLTSRGAGNVEWLAGLYGSYTRLHTPTEFLAQVSFSKFLIPVYSDDRRDRIGELAAYGEVSWDFLPGWTLAVGGRAFTIQTRIRSAVVSEAFEPRDVDREEVFSGFSPKISVQKTFGGGNLAYAVVSEGYRSGGINSGGARPLPADREMFGPDRLTNFEVGLKLEAMERRLAVNTALFYALWDDIQTDQFRESGIPFTTNAGDAQVIGIESELAYRTDFGLTVQLNGRITRTRTGRPNPAFITTQLADGLPGAPPISAGAVLSYERDLSDDWTLRLIGQASYVGRSRVSFEAAEPRAQSYTRAKLSAEITNGPLSVQAFVINPLNDLSDTFAFGNPFTINQDKVRQVTPQRPRTIGVTIARAL
jgi:iron complex outermembrane receptor protein